jgi:hypothetical protein
MKKSRKARTRPIPEVFSENVTDKMQQETDIKEYIATSPQLEALQSPKLPETYATLDTEVREKLLSRNNYYSVISRFTPYLIKNLLFISNSVNSSNRDKLQASKILLDKIMPSLEAQHVQIDSNVEGLVIVKSTKDKD